jgi:hypothetical protein
MSFFMNPFPQEYRGSLLLDDRQYSLTFDCPPNAGRGPGDARTFSEPNWDLSGVDADGNDTDLLTISYALDRHQMTFVDLQIDIGVGAASLASVRPAEIVTTLNTNVSFSTHFAARVAEGGGHIKLSTKKEPERIRWYIKRGGADTVLNFNKFVGIKELPTYFSRHTIDSRYDFVDGTAMLIELDPGGSTVDANMIDNAVSNKGVELGYDSSVVLDDYQLLGGRSSAFMFYKNTVDGSSRITQQIIYPAGAQVGDMAKLIKMTYTAAQTEPDQRTEEPYVLTSGDLITP